MGDDVHMRTQASTNLLIRHLLPQLVAASGPTAVEFARFLSGDHLFFLNLAMAAAKSLTMWAEQVDGSSIVTTMARNGTTFGVRLAGSADVVRSPRPPRSATPCTTPVSDRAAARATSATARCSS